MSEKKTNKKFEALELQDDHGEKSQEIQETVVNESQETSRQAEKLEAAREKATVESSDKAKVLNRIKAEQEVSAEEDITLRPVGEDLRKSTFQKEIIHVRRKLSKPDRLGSKVIHQPFVKSVSEVSSKTITRPSGLLGGGITAFLGTSIYLYLTKHIGLKYNYSIFLFLLIAGFILGLVIEAVFRMTRSKRSA